MLKNHIKTLLITLAIIIINQIPAKAQITSPWHEAGIFTGLSGYIGDLNPDKYLKFKSPLIGLVYKYNFDDRQAIKISLAYTKIQADDKESKSEWQKRRNLNFFSPITEITASYELSFFEYNPAIYQGLFLTPYISLGATFFKFDPQTILKGTKYHLRDYGTEGQGWTLYDKDGNVTTTGPKKYSLYSFALPIGVGVKFNLSKKINIFSELNYKFTFTDYLDDVSKNYAIIPTTSYKGLIGSELADRSPELGYEKNMVGSQRGNSSKKDIYMFVIIGITINFGIPECIGPL